MFPQYWNRERIIAEINSAWQNQLPNTVENRWKGISKSGVTIEGYKNPKPTAFPIQQNER